MLDVISGRSLVVELAWFSLVEFPKEPELWVPPGNDEFELTFVLQNLVQICSALISVNLLLPVQVVLQSWLDWFEGGGEGGQHQDLGGVAVGGETRSAPGKMAVCC